MRTIFLACAALLGIGALAAVGEQTPGDRAPKIAVVHVVHVTRNMQEGKKMKEALDTRYKEMQREQANKEAEINQLMQQLQQLKANSAQWTELRNTIDNKRFDLESWVKKMQLELQRRAKKDLQTAYEHVAQAVQTIAEEQHFDLVLADNSPDLGPDLDAYTPQQIEQALASRSVLFSGKRADITEDVLTRVEANFAKQTQAASIPPATVPGH